MRVRIGSSQSRVRRLSIWVADSVLESLRATPVRFSISHDLLECRRAVRDQMSARFSRK